MNNEIQEFTFFRSYYEAMQFIPLEARYELLMAIVEFVYEDKEAKLSGGTLGLWKVIRPHLQTSKNKSNKKSGAPRGNKNAEKKSDLLKPFGI